VFSFITVGPKNVLVVRCMDDYANMTCTSDAQDQIAWTYDGNTIIYAQCRAVTPDVFMANRQSAQQCGIVGSLKEALNEPNIISISGPYGCTDQTSAGITYTAMAIVLGMFRYFTRTVTYYGIK